MVISEIKGYVRGINYDSSKGVWINVEMNQVIGGVLEEFSAEIPFDAKVLNGKDIYEYLFNKKVKVTVETIDD